MDASKRGCALSETWHKCPIIILSRVDRTQCHQFEFDMLSLLLKWDLYLFIRFSWSSMMYSNVTCNITCNARSEAFVERAERKKLVKTMRDHSPNWYACYLSWGNSFSMQGDIHILQWMIDIGEIILQKNLSYGILNCFIRIFRRIFEIHLIQSLLAHIFEWSNADKIDFFSLR